MRRCAPVICATGLFLSVLFISNIARTATPGLPFTEDFSANNLEDSGKTTAVADQGKLRFDNPHRQYGPFSPTMTGVDVATNSNATTAIALGDMDGDGDLDLIEGNDAYSAVPNKLYLNDGAGNFDAGTNITADTDDTLDLAIGDLDNDGDLDFIAANDGVNRVYLNNGSGVFTGADVDSAESNYSPSIALYDLDGDGYLDLVEGIEAASNRVYFNDGDGTFTYDNSTPGAFETAAIKLADVTGDGIIDLVEGNDSQVDKVYPGNDSGSFGTGRDIHANAWQMGDIIALDIDNDGDLDIVTANGYETEPPQLYLNDGTGYSTPVAGIAIDPVDYIDYQNDVVFGDVDGDGDFDLIFGDYFYPKTLYLNNGDGTFGSGIEISTDDIYTSQMLLGDVDNDGDLDFIAGNNGESNRLYLNQSNDNPFSDVNGSDIAAATNNTVGLAVADFNLDGKLDIIAGNNSGANSTVHYIQDPIGTFTANAFGDPIVSGNVAVGDVNNDGQPDLAVAPVGIGENSLYQNDDGDMLAEGFITADNDFTVSLAFGDLNNDGWLDLVAGNTNTTVNRLYLNNGSGSFPAGANITSDANSTSKILLGDLNHDGFLDVVAVNNSSPNRFYINDGSGDPFDTVTGTNVSGDSLFSYDGALGDMDNDGDLDLVVGGNPSFLNVYEYNNATGLFASGASLSPGGAVYSVGVVDMDGDGDLDIVAGVYNQTNKIFLNNGDGTFSAGRSITSDAFTNEALAIADMNNDGQPDLVTGNWAQANRLYLNSGGPTGFGGSTATDITAETHFARDVAVGDLDHDGDLDVVLGRGNISGASPTPYTNRIFLNDGGGDPFDTATGTDVRTGDTNFTKSVVLADFNNDGDLDLVAGNDGVSNGLVNRFYPGNGDGTFNAGQDIGAVATGTNEIAVGDINNDGNLDFVEANFQHGTPDAYNYLYLGNGDGSFAAGETISTDNNRSADIAIGDLDNNGLPDIVVGNDEFSTTRYYMNTGSSPYFTTGADVTGDTIRTDSVALGDMDNDGDLDVVVGVDGVNKVYFNSGGGVPFPAGATASANITSDSDWTRKVILDDADNDGDLDIFAVNYDFASGAVPRLYLNDGTGTSFTRVDLATVGTRGVSGAVGDLDRDGASDLVIAQYNGYQAKLYRRKMYNTAHFKAQSLEVDNQATDILGVILNYTDTSSADNISSDFYVSNDGGNKFHKVQNGQPFTFPTTGADLRWKAELHSLSPIYTPLIDSVYIELTNQAPTAADNSVTTDEDTDKVFAASDFNYFDADGDPMAKVQATTVPGTGTLYNDANGNGAVDALEALGALDEVSKTDIDLGRLKFKPLPNDNGSPYTTFTFKVHDGTVYSNSAYTMTINVTAVNDAPTAADNSVTIAEDTDKVFAASDFNYSDIEGDPMAKVQVVTPPGAGTLYIDFNMDGIIDANEPLGASAEITRARIDGGRFKFKPFANGNGSPYTTFTFKVNDGTVYSDLAYTMTINVTPVPDPPTAANNTVATDEDTDKVFAASDFNYFDADGDPMDRVQIVTVSGSGTLYNDANGNGTIDGSETVVAPVEVAKTDIDLGRLKFKPVANENGNSYATFTFRVHDGTVYSVSSYTMTINVTPINDPPNNTAVPTVSGIHKVGQVLFASSGTWNDNTDMIPGILTYTYKWPMTAAALMQHLLQVQRTRPTRSSRRIRTST